MSGLEEMKRYASALFMLVALCSLAVSGRAMIAEKDDIPGIPSMLPEGNEPIRASVVNTDPDNFTLDVRKFANIGVDEGAQTFAIYIDTSLPRKCADFRGLNLPMWKSAKYKRSLNLSSHPEVIEGLNGYGCIVILNKEAAED